MTRIVHTLQSRRSRTSLAPSFRLRAALIAAVASWRVAAAPTNDSVQPAVLASPLAFPFQDTEAFTTADELSVQIIHCGFIGNERRLPLVPLDDGEASTQNEDSERICERVCAHFCDGGRARSYFDLKRNCLANLADFCQVTITASNFIAPSPEPEHYAGENASIVTAAATAVKREEGSSDEGNEEERIVKEGNKDDVSVEADLQTDSDEGNKGDPTGDSDDEEAYDTPGLYMPFDSEFIRIPHCSIERRQSQVTPVLESVSEIEPAVDTTEAAEDEDSEMEASAEEKERKEEVKEEVKEEIKEEVKDELMENTGLYEAAIKVPFLRREVSLTTTSSSSSAPVLVSNLDFVRARIPTAHWDGDCYLNPQVEAAVAHASFEAVCEGHDASPLIFQPVPSIFDVFARHGDVHSDVLVELTTFFTTLNSDFSRPGDMEETGKTGKTRETGYTKPELESENVVVVLRSHCKPVSRASGQVSLLQRRTFTGWNRQLQDKAALRAAQLTMSQPQVHRESLAKTEKRTKLLSSGVLNRFTKLSTLTLCLPLLAVLGVSFS